MAVPGHREPSLQLGSEALVDEEAQIAHRIGGDEAHAHLGHRIVPDPALGVGVLDTGGQHRHHRHSHHPCPDPGPLHSPRHRRILV